MENPRAEKVAVVDEVKARLNDADAAILTEYRGLTVTDLETLRGQLRTSGAEYKVYKNTLVRFAVRDLDLGELEGSLTGPTAIAFVKGDAAAVAKTLRDFSKGNPKLVVKGGVLGSKTLSSADTAALADLPSREVLLAQLAGLFAQPLQQFAGLLQAVPRNFAYGLKALVDQGGAAGAPASTAGEQPEATADAPADADAEAAAPAEAAAEPSAESATESE